MLLTEAPQARLTDIYETDQRLAGSFRYLQLAGSAALDIAAAVFAESPALGEAVVFAALSMHAKRTGFEKEILQLLETEADAITALAEAFRYVGKEVQRDVFYPWIKHDEPFLASAALAAATLLRLHLRDLLIPYVTDPRPLVRGRAFEYAGVMGLSAHAPVALAALAEPDADLSFQAAVASVRLGRPQAATALAARIGGDTPPWQCRLAVELSFPLLPEDVSHAHVRALLKQEDTQRWGLLGLGVIGSTRTLPYLLQVMEEPRVTRMAGWAFAMITGANIAEDDLELEAFPETEDDPLLEGAAEELFFEDGLPFPDPARVHDWLIAKGRNLSGEHPLLFGLPQWSWQDMESPDLEFQGRYRALAQVLSLRSGEGRLPNWRAPVRLMAGKLTRDWQM